MVNVVMTKLLGVIFPYLGHAIVYMPKQVRFQVVHSICGSHG